MCTSPEAFLSLRSHFVSSHALLCVSHWVLGIGDRHLSNFMVDTDSGGMIGIDFGHAFGSATQVSQKPGGEVRRRVLSRDAQAVSCVPSSFPCRSSCPSG